MQQEPLVESEETSQHKALNLEYHRKALDLEQPFLQIVARTEQLVTEILSKPHADFVKHKLVELATRAKRVESKTENFNFINLCLVIQWVKDMLEHFNKDLKSSIDGLSSLKGSKLDETRALIKKKIAIFVDKCHQMTLFLEYSKDVPLNDLYCQKEDSADWKLVRSISRVFLFFPAEVAQEDYSRHGMKIFFMLAAIGRARRLVPKTEEEIDEFLNRTFKTPSDPLPVFLDSVKTKTVSEEDIGTVNKELLYRMMRYTNNPEAGLIDGGFFVANPDFNIIRTLFNFQEKKWIKLIRNNLHSESVETDLKVYLSPNMFADWFEDRKRDRPNNIKDGVSVLTFSANDVAGRKIFSRPEAPSKGKSSQEPDELDNEDMKDEFVRVRLLYHTKLKSFQKKISEITKESQSTLRARTILSQKERAQFGSPAKGKTYLDEESAFIKKNPDLGQGDVAVLQPTQAVFDSDSAFRKPYWTSVSKRKLAPSQLVWAVSIHISRMARVGGFSPAKSLSSASSLPRILDEKDQHSPPKRTVKMPNTEMMMVPDNWTNSLCGGWLSSEDESAFQRIIIHIHGGGFVAQSSSSHKVYMSKWVNDLKRPIFSIDYRLADSEIHFPEPVNDVIRGYLWILNFLQHVVKCNPKQIILVGDSAGGNMALCLVTWCIVNKVRAPDSMMLFYPAMSTRMQQFTPSLLYSLSDFMLSYSTLKMCGTYYNNNLPNQETNPYLSPILLPDEILAQMPMTEIYIGEKDPLRDDCVRYALRLLKLGVPIKLNYLQGLSHGLLSTSYKGGIPGAEAFFKEASKSLRDTLNIPL